LKSAIAAGDCAKHRHLFLRRGGRHGFSAPQSGHSSGDARLRTTASIRTMSNG